MRDRLAGRQGEITLPRFDPRKDSCFLGRLPFYLMRISRRLGAHGTANAFRRLACAEDEAIVSSLDQTNKAL